MENVFRMVLQPRAITTGRLMRVTSVVCVCLMLTLAGIQAVHAHSAGFRAENHDCSVCSALHAGILGTAGNQAIPLLTSVAASPGKDPCTQTLLLVRALYIRPPPSV